MMRAARRIPQRGALILGVALLATPLGSCDDRNPVRATLSVAETLASADTAGFARAVEPREFAFPADHGPHPEYRHEWWYFTGNLATADGESFGFQLTFFRSALRPHPSPITSEWATSQAWMGHFAVTDVARDRFAAFERFERGALGLAGAGRVGDATRVWVGEWEARVADDGTWRVHASEGDVDLRLQLDPAGPVVLQGDRGLSRKGPEPGNASYYYSLPWLRAEGTVVAEGREAAVTGTAWLDREWGTSALGPELAGWDWFSLQLDDGAALMVYRLRRKDGGTDRFSAGTYLHPDGRVVRLGADDFVLDETDTWTSPAGVRYPSGWRVRVPGVGVDIVASPRVRDQELDLVFRYWEGAVTVEGSGPDGAVEGVGYVELTGYDDTAG